ncbi:MAG: PIG-L family deacetylase [Chloroflexi bacterium]|nr:PIG-L family deacetylase [Chloroflexota bacterium]
MTQQQKILIIAAHPDDEVLGCGGLIPQLVSRGHKVYISILCEGITGRYQKREHADPALLQAVEASSMEAAKILGATNFRNYNLPDQRLDTIPLLELTKLIENTIEELVPDVIYTHHGGDINLDHLLTHRATLTATRPIAGKVVRDVYAFEVPASTEWAFHQFEPSFRPNVFVNIAGSLDTKIRAYSVYTTEARPFPHPRSPEIIRATAARWGSIVGLAAAEAFELIRSIRSI